MILLLIISRMANQKFSQLTMETAVILLISVIAGGLTASNPVVYNVHTIQQVSLHCLFSLLKSYIDHKINNQEMFKSFVLKEV